MTSGMLQRVRYICTQLSKIIDISFILGLRKKLEAAAKVKDCAIIGHWQKSIINHLYWCVASTSSDHGELIKAKWLSLDNHIHNVHTHKNKDFQKCAHGKLRGRDKNKQWFKRRKCAYLSAIDMILHDGLMNLLDSKASEKLSPLLTNNQLCKDVTRLSPLYQTSSLEAFHSVVIHFAPKFVALSYQGMNCRYTKHAH